MSVTFSLPREFATVGRPENMDDEDAFMAYYDACCDVDGEFNVANGNAAYIVHDILNVPTTDDYYGGELDPTTVLMKVALYFDPKNGVEEGRVEQGVILNENGVAPGGTFIYCGRSERQVDSYLTRLKALAELAVERGAPEIQWG